MYIYIYIYLYSHILFIILPSFRVRVSKSVRVSKKHQFSKTSRTRNNIFLLILQDSVMKFKYFPSNIHHFCLSIVSHVILPKKFNFHFAGNKYWSVCFDANIS